MEDFEEMKLYWNQLAEKNNVDSETNKKILESIMSNRYKSLTGKMIKERVIGMMIYLGDIKLQYTAVKVTAMIVIPICGCFIHLAYLHEKKRIKAFEEIIDGQDSCNYA